ncbi:MAG: DUF4435 domain-containing protein [Methylococcales bacterium]
MTTFCVADTGGLDAALIMFRASPENKQCSFLFVEGDSDEKFWNARILEKACCIVFVVSFQKNNQKQTGKASVIKNISDLNESKSRLDGFLGIIDNDFDALMNLPSINNTCVTDSHDLETLLLSSPRVFKALLAEYGDSQLIADFEKKAQKCIQDYLIELALPFAQIEWLKQHLQPGLELKELHKKNTLLIPDKWCLNQIDLHTFANTKGIDITSKQSRQLLEKMDHVNPWLLCNGHIMIDILSFGFQKGALGKNKQATSDNISSYIRGAMDKIELYQTELCQSIFNWQVNHPPYQVLP